MGLLGDITSSVTGTIDAGTGGWWSDQSTKASAKRQYNYAYNLQMENQAFQRELAKNAHQWEMQDLQAAGLNPALTATGSSAGSIASGASPQSTNSGQAVNTLSDIVNGINSTRTTNANVEKTNAEKNAIPQQIANETTNAKANLISAEAAQKQAETQEKVARGGYLARNIGTQLVDAIDTMKFKNNRMNKNLPLRKQTKEFLINAKNSAK